MLPPKQARLWIWIPPTSVAQSITAGEPLNDLGILVELRKGHGGADLEPPLGRPAVAGQLGDVLHIDELIDLLPPLAQLDDDVRATGEEG